MSKDQKYLDQLRHSSAHLLGAAVLELYPKAKLAIGPAIENGFYYDIDFGKIKISEDDLHKIEGKMHEIVRSWKAYKRFNDSIHQIRKEFANNPYKLELAEEFYKEKKKLTIIQFGDFRDLCRGGHIKNPSRELKYFKLLSVAGAYWRGDEKNKMLTRIYGTAFTTKEALEQYLEMVEDRKKNDHRTLGKKLDLFCFSDLVGKGLVMYTPKGTIVKNELKNALVEISKKYGVQEVDIPHMANIKLYETSGHAQKFEEELFIVKSHYKEEFVLKPVNCPHHTQIYASRKRSYKELPIRYIESTQQHRDEKPGSIGGLNRTRSFEIDDGHTFCVPNQIKDEVINTIKIIEEFYKSLGMWDGHWVSLSFRDEGNKDKYIGKNKDWIKAQNMLVEIDKELVLNSKVVEGQAAIYGPKIDFMYNDLFGNSVQLATVQVDFAMPQRFGLTYTDENGNEQTPVMLHRAILGSYGRFIANLLESTGGSFPVWLSPVQVKILPITDRNLAYSKKVVVKLLEVDIRAEVDESNETLGNKIRKAQEEKVPYMIIIGDKEESADKVAIRLRDGNDLGQMDLDEFTKRVLVKITEKSLEL